jgi:putative transposase
MNGFRDPLRTQIFLSSFGPIRQHFALSRHRMTAQCHRIKLKARLTAWHRWSVVDAAKCEN